MTELKRFDFQYTQVSQGVESEHVQIIYAFDRPCACEKWARMQLTQPAATQTLNSITEVD